LDFIQDTLVRQIASKLAFALTYLYLCDMGKNKALKYIIQLIGWGIVFGFPLFFNWKEADPMTWTKYLGYVFVPVVFMIIFYMNYFFLIDRLLFRRGVIQFLAVNLALFVVLSLLLDGWHGCYAIHVLGEKHHGGGPPKMMFILRDGMMMALTAALSVAIRMTENWYVIEDEKKELEKARTEAELQNLKSQLNPHFLFNTLNNIYSLIAINPDRAQYAVHDLSRLLRHVLYEDKQLFVSLDQELIFMKSYIELMSLRLSDKVDLQISMPDDGKGIRVAPLLFITLIENAFKHGISPNGKSFIHIAFQVEESGKMCCRIENSYYPKKDNDRSGSGIGLENLKKRLGLLYPGKYSLKTGREEEAYVAELVLEERKWN